MTIPPPLPFQPSSQARSYYYKKKKKKIGGGGSGSSSGIVLGSSRSSQTPLSHDLEKFDLASEKNAFIKLPYKILEKMLKKI
jgi:hypothetical protein